MAGAAGIEPANGGIKSRCLTTWLRPIKTVVGAEHKAKLQLPQDPEPALLLNLFV